MRLSPFLLSGTPAASRGGASRVALPSTHLGLDCSADLGQWPGYSLFLSQRCVWTPLTDLAMHVDVRCVVYTCICGALICELAALGLVPTRALGAWHQTWDLVLCTRY